jgi:hypothetical protein
MTLAKTGEHSPRQIHQVIMQRSVTAKSIPPVIDVE